MTGHEIIEFKKMMTHTQRARAKRGFYIVVLVSSHRSMISINFNRKVIFYMYKQYSNTFGLVKYIYRTKKSVRFLWRFGVELAKNRSFKISI